MLPEGPQIARLRHRMLGSRRRVVGVGQPLGLVREQAATITGISAMPSCRAASTLAWPAIRPPSSPTSAGVVQPHSLMLAAIAAT